MAVSVLRALLAAQARSAWNRIRHESGLGGPLAAVAVLGVVALIVAGPCFLTLRLGLELGEELKSSADAASQLRWRCGEHREWVYGILRRKDRFRIFSKG